MDDLDVLGVGLQGSTSTPVFAGGELPGVNVSGAATGIGAMLGGPVGAGIGSLVGGFLQNRASASQAQKQMDFQERMSNTSYQRAVQDMKAAGLSPMLAYGKGGASTPSGSAAPMTSELGAGVSSALQGASTAATVKNIEQDTELKKAQANQSDDQAANIRADTALMVLRDPLIRSNTTLNQSSARQAEALADSAYETLRKTQQETSYLQATMEPRVAEAHASADRSQSQAQLEALGIPRARNRADYERSWWARNVDPYTESVSRVAASARDASIGLGSIPGSLGGLYDWAKRKFGSKITLTPFVN